MLCCSLLFNVQQHTALWKTNLTPSWSSFYLHICHIYVSHHHTNTNEGNPLKDTMQLQNNGFIYEGVGKKTNSKSSSAATTAVTETFTVLPGILTHSPLQNCSNSTTLEGFGAWTAPLRSQQLDFSLGFDSTEPFILFSISQSEVNLQGCSAAEPCRSVLQFEAMIWWPDVLHQHIQVH